MLGGVSGNTAHHKRNHENLQLICLLLSSEFKERMH